MGTDSTGVRLGAGTTGEPPNRGALLGRTPAACAHEHWGAWPGSGGSASREPTFVTGSSPVGAAGPGEGPSTNPLEGLPGMEPLGVLGAEARRTGRGESGSDCASAEPRGGGSTCRGPGAGGRRRAVRRAQEARSGSRSGETRLGQGVGSPECPVRASGQRGNRGVFRQARGASGFLSSSDCSLSAETPRPSGACAPARVPTCPRHPPFEGI